MSAPVPRTVNGEVLIPTDSKHPYHADMFKTLDLLALDTHHGRVFFVIKGVATFGDMAEIRESHSWLYEEQSCATNFIPVEAILMRKGMPDEDDPHGLFEYIDTVWLTQAYLDAEKNGKGMAYLRQVFPQLNEPEPQKEGE